MTRLTLSLRLLLTYVFCFQPPAHQVWDKMPLVLKSSDVYQGPASLRTFDTYFPSQRSDDIDWTAIKNAMPRVVSMLQEEYASALTMTTTVEDAEISVTKEEIARHRAKSSDLLKSFSAGSHSLSPATSVPEIGDTHVPEIGDTHVPEIGDTPSTSTDAEVLAFESDSPRVSACQTVVEVATEDLETEGEHVSVSVHDRSRQTSSDDRLWAIVYYFSTHGYSNSTEQVLQSIWPELSPPSTIRNDLIVASACLFGPKQERAMSSLSTSSIINHVASTRSMSAFTSTQDQESQTDLNQNVYLDRAARAENYLKNAFDLVPTVAQLSSLIPQGFLMQARPPARPIPALLSSRHLLSSQLAHLVQAKAVLIFVYAPDEDGALVCQLPPSIQSAAVSPAPSPRDSSSPLSSPFSHLTIPTAFAQSGRTASMRRTSRINPHMQPPSARLAEQVGGATAEADTLMEKNGCIGKTFTQNTAIVIANVSADDDIGCLQQCSLDISSVACVPLRAGNTPFGVVVWINKLSGNPFGDDDIPTLTTLSAIVSANLSSSAYFSSCALQLQQVSALRFRYQKYVEICVAILEGHRTMAHVCETMMKQCAQLVNCERCTLYIADAARQELYSIVVCDLINRLTPMWFFIFFLLMLLF
jgi:GAF domain-containing protein